jgi:membrane AbrB-like protein
MNVAPATGPVRHASVLGGAFAGGLLATTLGVPAGGVLGAVVGAVCVNLWRPGDRLPRPFREAGKILLGTVVGLSFAPALMSTIVAALLPIAVGVALLIVSGLAVSVLLHVRFGWDLPTALYAATPGGLSELAIVAHEEGAQGHIVIAVHTVRVATIVILGPPLLTLLLSLWPSS